MLKNKSIDYIFGMITGVALMLALSFGADTEIDDNISKKPSNFTDLYNNTIYMKTGFWSLKVKDGYGKLYTLKEYSNLIDGCDLATLKYNSYKQNTTRGWVLYGAGLLGMMISANDELNLPLYLISASVSIGGLIYYNIQGTDDLYKSQWEYNKCVLNDRIIGSN